ncbi:MAG: mevalonate kinase [Aggregatilineales bacterium]
MITASAPAKSILLGEHAVVYGQPALAVPLSSLRAKATVTANPPNVSGLRITGSETGDILPLEIDAEIVDNALALTAHLVLKHLGIAAPPDITISLRSDIPVASGLGSGAAVSTALARALCAAVNRMIDDEALNAIVYEVEKVYHGTPSGIDNTVIVFEHPVYFVRGAPPQRFALRRSMTLLIGDTGLRASTRVAIDDVRALYAKEPERIGNIFSAIGTLAEQGRAALITGDLVQLGELMNANHMLLRELTVSCPELERLTEAARSAGALGAKLSGGGRGGNMIALVEHEAIKPVCSALLSAGAARVLAVQLGGIANGDFR